MSQEAKTYRSHAEIVADVLSRYSVQDLYEQSDVDLYMGDERFYRATGSFNVIEQGETGLIKWWKIQSGEKHYECRRFKNFVYCSCPSFFFNKKMCKHLAITTAVYCSNCFQLPAKVGKLCYDCDVNAHQFLRQSSPVTATSLN